MGTKVFCILFGDARRRLGAVLSPKLFSVYIDDLSNALLSEKIGCYIDNSCINHLIYADDMCLFAPTSFCLQKLLDVCNVFSKFISFNS